MPPVLRLRELSAQMKCRMLSRLVVDIAMRGRQPRNRRRLACGTAKMLKVCGQYPVLWIMSWTNLALTVVLTYAGTLCTR